MSGENKPYTIVEADSPIHLMEAVEDLLKRGYVLIGGAQVVAHRPDGRLSDTGLQFFQTMVSNEV